MISVCINNYNYERFLGAAIDSALAEHDRSAVDSEVVVVDDGSTDDSRAIIEGYGDRIRAVFTANGGQAAAFNAGFEVARGDAVVFLDADDLLLPGVLDALAAAFDAVARPAKVQVRMAVIDADGAPTGELIPGRPRPSRSVDLGDHVRRFRSYPWPPSSANAYDRTALDEVLPIPEPEYRGSCDSYLAELMPYLGPVVDLETVGVAYRLHTGNDYFGTALDPVWLRTKMARLVRNHERAVAVAERRGVPGPPPDPLAPLDVALLGFRMASLRVDPGGHPFPGDRPRRLALRGVRASWTNPLLTTRDRVIRPVWFVLAGFLPQRAAGRLVHRFVPDTPLRLRPAWLKRRAGRSST